ncbi:uncharacterized protein JCM6883_000025 [Sporobolomyces salmoneus]|uniref:uncharacterized protein n=1 Tax=Sporobolomyces salmoneus TaxID=183962 RepID=UPI003181FA32
MDRLPVELPRAIADSISSNSWIFDAQKDLAVLSRVNKTFYTICRHRIYLSPVLGNARMVKKWIRNYSSLVNPWSICAGTQHLKDVIVPEAVIFEVYKTPIEELEDEEFNGFDRRLGPVDQFLPPLNNFAFSTFFFRNITSITVSYLFPIPEDFIVSLCGPSGRNRNILRKFSIEEDDGGWLTGFLFEAHNRMVWETYDLNYLEYLDLIAQLRHCDPLCKSIHERKEAAAQEEEEEKEDGRCYISDAEFDKLDEIASKYGSSNYQVSRLLSPSPYSSPDHLPVILETRTVPCHPFSALRSLTTVVTMTYEVYLLLHSRLFPVLRELKLVGYFGSPVTIAYDVKLLRCSITKREGKISEPEVDDSVFAAHPNLFNSWDPLTEDEMENDPKIDYCGPNLNELDLSECKIVARE